MAALSCLLAVSLVLIAMTVLFAGQRQDRLQRANEEGMVAASLAQLGRALGGNLVDYAQWDDAVQNLELAFSPAWARRNIGPPLHDALGYDVTLLLDLMGHPVYGQVMGNEDAAVAAAQLGPEVARLRELAHGTAEGEPVVAALGGDGRWLLAAAAVVVPEPGSTLTVPAEAACVLLFAKALDDGYLAQFARDFGLASVAIEEPGQPAADRAAVALPGPEGTPVAQLVWTPRRPGHEQLVWALPALLGSLLAVLIFALLALRGLRLARALQESEARLRDFAEVSSDWWWETDPGGRFVWLSPGFGSLLGIDPTRMLGRTRRELAGADSTEPPWATHADDLAAGRPFRDLVYTIHAVGDRPRTVRASGRPVRDGDGKVLGYRGIGRDITEGWEAAQRLRESEQRFRSLVENLRGIVFCRGVAGDGPHGYDRDGMRLFGDDASRLALTEADGNRLRLEEWHAAIDPSDREVYLAAERRRKEQGEPYTLEFRLRTPRTGELRWLREVAWVVDTPEDGRRYLDSYLIDITEEKQAALALQESELRLQLALSAGRMGTWDVDLITGVERWNEVHFRLFGVEPGDFVPSSAEFEARLDPRDRERIHALAEDVIGGRTDSDFTNDYRVVLPDGTIRWIAGGGRLLRDVEGRPVRLLGVSFDITERMERQEALEAAQARLVEQAALLAERNRELEAANLAKDRFVASVSHEIRTPMNAVLGFADLLAGTALSPSQARYVQVVRNTGKQLLVLLNDILDMAKIEAGRLDLESIDFALAACLEQVRSLLAPQARERGLELLVASDVPADLVLRGDPTRVNQVLVNLIGNGIKFTAQGRVALNVRETAADGERVTLRFEVRDTGIGIAPERRAQLFRPFAQADSSIARTYGGTGLGLAICRSLVDAMDGTIGVETEPDCGSLFWFEIPFARGQVAPRAEPDPDSVPTPSALRILVADDVATNRELLGHVLRNHGHTVLFAEDGEAALEIASSETLDLILMDVQMPSLDGIAATARIRQLPLPRSTVPIFALTAGAMAAERARCLGAGMDLCLTKPIVWTEFHAAIAGVAPRSVPTQLAPAADLAIVDLDVLGKTAAQ
jgi:PAS domain S-box-containing protein